MTCLALRLPAPVITAVPTGVLPIRLHSSWIDGPPWSRIAPATPPPELQMLVGGVDDRVDVELGDVALDELEQACCSS